MVVAAAALHADVERSLTLAPFGSSVPLLDVSLS